MSKKHLLAIIFSATIAVMWGCTGITPYHEESTLNKNWGRSLETAKYNQIINPDAGNNTEPVSGLDGSAGEYNMGKYKDSFKKAGPKEVVNILKLQ